MRQVGETYGLIASETRDAYIAGGETGKIYTLDASEVEALLAYSKLRIERVSTTEIISRGGINTLASPTRFLIYDRSGTYNGEYSRSRDMHSDMDSDMDDIITLEVNNGTRLEKVAKDLLGIIQIRTCYGR